MGNNDDVFYPRLLGAIFPEAVRQAQAERDRAAREALDAYVCGWDMGIGDHPVFVIRPPAPPAPASPLPSWRSRTPAEMAEYDRRFLHVLGIAWDADLNGAPRS